ERALPDDGIMVTCRVPVPTDEPGMPTRGRGRRAIERPPLDQAPGVGAAASRETDARLGLGALARVADPVAVGGGGGSVGEPRAGIQRVADAVSIGVRRYVRAAGRRVTALHRARVPVVGTDDRFVQAGGGGISAAVHGARVPVVARRMPR